MPAIRRICGCGFYLPDRMNDKFCPTTSEMAIARMVRLSDTLRQLGIWQGRTKELAFNQYVGSARTIEKSAQLLFVPVRLQRKFNPRRFFGAGGIIHDSEIQSFAEHAGNSHRLMVTLADGFLQKTQGIVPWLCWGGLSEACCCEKEQHKNSMKDCLQLPSPRLSCSLLLRQRFHARQLLAFQKLQRSAAAG